MRPRTTAPVGRPLARPPEQTRARYPDDDGFVERDGVLLRPYVYDLYLHLAARDLAVVQGGLTTSMELTADRRPFLN